MKQDVIIIGAGPAGLTSAFELVKNDRSVTVVEMSDLVGGIARTVSYKGYRFDIGGHRFFTKIKEVEPIWHELLGDDLLVRPRLSRIFYDGKYFDYPLKPFNTLSNLGIFTSISVALSYLQSVLFPYPNEDTFEDWVSNRFGKKLYSIFFKTYTEKVWGIPCSEIHAEWAAQRIQGLSFLVAVRNALFRYPTGEVKSLINQFLYPRLGPGMMWEAARDYVEAKGSVVQMNTRITRVVHDGETVQYVEGLCQDGQLCRFEGADFISSMPITELVFVMDPPAPPELVEAAKSLTYRDFLTVVLIVDNPELFPDNWLYIHDPSVHVGRIQNFKNWSPEMVPDLSKTSLGLEYFCTEGDQLWNMKDEDLIKLGIVECEQIGLITPEEVIDGVIVRQRKAYPVYTRTYGVGLQKIKEYLAGFKNLQTIGRNGLHKYNNQDHSMLTAMLAARNIMGENHDVWEVNTERSYYEEVRIPHDALSSDELGTS